MAILVDEYDKPLIDNIDDLDLVDQNRQKLKNIYSVRQGLDHSIAFLILSAVNF